MAKKLIALGLCFTFFSSLPAMAQSCSDYYEDRLQENQRKKYALMGAGAFIFGTKLVHNNQADGSDDEKLMDAYVAGGGLALAMTGMISLMLNKSGTTIPTPLRKLLLIDAATNPVHPYKYVGQGKLNKRAFMQKFIDENNGQSPYLTKKTVIEYLDDLVPETLEKPAFARKIDKLTNTTTRQRVKDIARQALNASMAERVNAAVDAMPDKDPYPFNAEVHKYIETVKVLDVISDKHFEAMANEEFKNGLHRSDRFGRRRRFLRLTKTLDKDLRKKVQATIKSLPFLTEEELLSMKDRGVTYMPMTINQRQNWDIVWRAEDKKDYLHDFYLKLKKKCPTLDEQEMIQTIKVLSDRGDLCAPHMNDKEYEEIYGVTPRENSNFSRRKTKTFHYKVGSKKKKTPLKKAVSKIQRADRERKKTEMAEAEKAMKEARGKLVAAQLAYKEDKSEKNKAAVDKAREEALEAKKDVRMTERQPHKEVKKRVAQSRALFDPNYNGMASNNEYVTETIELRKSLSLKIFGQRVLAKACTN